MHGELTPVNKFSGKQSFILSKFSETFISRLMGKKEKNTIAAKAKKPLNATTSPELLTKPVSSSVTPLKQEPGKPGDRFLFEADLSIKKI